MAKHLVLVGFPAFGHMIPLLALAKKLAAGGCRVTVAVSAAMLNQLRQRGNLCAADEKQFETFPVDDGIAEADLGFIWPKVWTHVIPGLEKYVESLSPASVLREDLTEVDVLIADVFVTLTASASKKRGIPFYLFFTSPLILLNTLLCMDESTPEATTEPRATFLPDAAGLKRGQVKSPTASMLKKVGLDVGRTIGDYKGVLVNSFRDLEGDTVDLFLSNTGRSDLEIYCIGPVFPDEPERTSEEEVVRNKVRNWLDQKKPGSVTYVAFGSLVALPPVQVHEIGNALLDLKTPFIYSVRTDNQIHLPEAMQAQVPFQLDSPDSSWLVLNWAPQDLILNHPSVQVFVTHCGWNSTVESMIAKKPTCTWPIFGDQLENARIMGKCGMGLLVTGEGDQYKKFVSAEDIRSKIREDGGWNIDGTTAGKTPYASAAELWGRKIKAAIAPSGSSQNEFADFLSHC